MGMDADAMLFFGCEFGDDEDAPEDWEEVVARAAGIKEPPAVFPDRDDKSPEAEAVLKEYHARWKKKNEVVKACECEMDFWGTGGYEQHFAAIKRLYWHCDWEKALEIPVPLPQPTDEEIEKLKKFVSLMGLRWCEPKWWMVARYW